MRAATIVSFSVLVAALFLPPSLALATGPVPCPPGSPPRVCVPDRPIPPESVGGISMPFDVPIWPTLLKTEFHIMPWVSFGKASICLPFSCKSIELPAPCFSLKAIPVWIPWLRPIDAECKDSEVLVMP